MLLANRSMKSKFNFLTMQVILGFLLTLGLTSMALHSLRKGYESYSKIGVEIQIRTLMVARDQNFLSRLIRSIYLGESWDCTAPHFPGPPGGVIHGTEMRRT